ncbi:hypothetical protein ALC53_09487 [Atta colombica]|uniref:Uncharacterized protein n=1 Tax=Atta colombica TaxID=520822 RepID=A0A151I1I4_9HYME|nr:hypothetical protein ALC53_09487 [Atta colombica]
MIYIETHNNLNKILLLAVGLWPYQQSKFTQLQFIFFCTILSADIIFQLTPLIILKCTLDLEIKVLSSVSFAILCMIKYNALHRNIEIVKNLLMELRYIFNELKDKNEIVIIYKYSCNAKRYTITLTANYMGQNIIDHNNHVKNLFVELRYILNELKDKNEIAIIYKYSCTAKRYTITLTGFGICGMFSLIIIQIWSFIADVNTMNISQSHHLLIMTEYLVDQEKYFYWILLYMYTILYIASIIMLGTGTMLITYIEHICGIFKIASYRIKHAVNTYVPQNITIKNKTLMIEDIICAIDIHRQAMKYVSVFFTLCDTFTNILFLRMTKHFMTIFEIMIEFLLPFLFASTSILYMFIAHYVGQNIIDHNNHVFVTAYNVQWYKTPLHIQRMILFLLQRRTKKFSLNLGGIFDASIEGFATVKNLLKELRYIFDDLKDKNEIAIIYKYNCIAKRYTVTLLVFGICGLFITIITQIWSFIAVNISMNMSQPHHLFILTEYFVNQEKYFYWMLLHMYGVLCVGMTIMIATGTMLISYLQHTCGMFKIASLYMFLANYMGQNIIDHNNHVFFTAYNVQWYRMPLHIQKVILFLLQRNTKKFVLSVGGIFEGSVEHFATVI